MTNTYYFVDDNSGEDFFIEATCIEYARNLARDYFEEPRFIRKVSEEEAESWGLDTY